MKVIALVDRWYEEEPPWGGRVRVAGLDPDLPWCVSVDHGEDDREQTPLEERWFEDVESAIDWGRQRAELVLVRLGSSDEHIYSAGAARANESVDGSGSDYPEWPPDNWPDYRGPEAERRRFFSTYAGQNVEASDEGSSPRFSYGFVPLEPDREPGGHFEGFLIARSRLGCGDEVRFPTLGWDTWEVVELTGTPPPDDVDEWGPLLGGESVFIHCRGLTRRADRSGAR